MVPPKLAAETTANEASAEETSGDDVSVEDQIIDAALALTRTRPWSEVILSDVAQVAGVTLADLHMFFDSKKSILNAFSRRTDVSVLRAVDPEDQDGESPKDRLFDVLMLRFDELQKDKPAAMAIARHFKGDPFGLLAGVKPALRAMHWMLEAAAIDGGGVKGAVRARALGVVWLAAFRVWLDDGDDMSKTMAELDRRLQQSVALWGTDDAATAEA